MQLLLTEARGRCSNPSQNWQEAGYSPVYVAASSSGPVRAEVKSESKTSTTPAATGALDTLTAQEAAAPPGTAQGSSQQPHREITTDQHIIAPKIKKWCLC